MDPNQQWRPPMGPPPPPPAIPSPRRPWLPAAIIGAAIVIAAGLIAGALILKKDDKASGPTTCEAWSETRLTLRAIPALPNNWTFKTPNIATLIRNQNAPVAKALDIFEPKIQAEPADVARAAKDYVAARRHQIQTLSDGSYKPADGAEVDTALERLNELCGITPDGQRI
jgi:hypothetical protein